MVLRVSDLARSEEFYRNVLGMQQSFRYELGNGAIEVAFGYPNAAGVVTGAGIVLLHEPRRSAPFEHGNTYSRYVLAVPNVKETFERLQKLGLSNLRSRCPTRSSRPSLASRRIRMVTESSSWSASRTRDARFNCQPAARAPWVQRQERCACMHVAIPAIDACVAVEVRAHPHHVAVFVVLPAVRTPLLCRAAPAQITFGARGLSLVEKILRVDLAVAVLVELLGPQLAVLKYQRAVETAVKVAVGVFAQRAAFVVVPAHDVLRPSPSRSSWRQIMTVRESTPALMATCTLRTSGRPSR